MKTTAWRRHLWLNRFQTVLMITVLLGISLLAGSLLLGADGFWLALAVSLIALFIEPLATWRLTLGLYRARPIAPIEAPQLWQVLLVLAERAELPAAPNLYYIPSPVINAFAVGRAKHSAIALTDGLLSRLSLRELAGILGHEVAHIAHGDLRVMGMADFISRLTHLFSFAGQMFLLFSLPWLLLGGYSIEINWWALLLLLFAPQLALLAQLGLSRIREYDADLKAAALTGDPMGLASALAHIERASRSWLSVLLPGWGNPAPSWLRTHPSTNERIRRLQELMPKDYRAFWLTDNLPVGFVATPVVRSPRWRIGGLWR
ncbi:MAG: zinc metalloprotease HtpX [Gammaproteobacteria bacterium]